MAKKEQPNHEVPLNEDYQEVGKKFEYANDEEREKARKLADKKVGLAQKVVDKVKGK